MRARKMPGIGGAGCGALRPFGGDLLYHSLSLLRQFSAP